MNDDLMMEFIERIYIRREKHDWPTTGNIYHERTKYLSFFV